MPVSATYLCGRAAFAVESELISETKTMLKASAIDNVILRFIIFLSYVVIVVLTPPSRIRSVTCAKRRYSSSGFKSRGT
jgi:hypothetical protein